MEKRSDSSLLAAGTNMQSSQCPSGTVNSACQATFLGIYLTSGSSAYLEVFESVAPNPLI
jgi:broad specificity polyphosphatase/5'/3'-nucleotidase SurE